MPPQKPDFSQLPVQSGPVRPDFSQLPVQSSWYDSIFTVPTAIRTVPAIAGGIVGGAIGGGAGLFGGPAAPVTSPAGAAAGSAIGSGIGSGLGEWLAELYEGTPVSLPTIGVETGIGAIPFGKLAKYVPFESPALREGVSGLFQGAGLGAAGAIPRHMARTGQMTDIEGPFGMNVPSWGQVGAETLGGAGFGAVTGAGFGAAFGSEPRVRRAGDTPTPPPPPDMSIPGPQPRLPGLEEVNFQARTPETPYNKPSGVPLDSGPAAEQIARHTAGIDVKVQQKIFELEVQKSEAARAGDANAATAIEQQILEVKMHGEAAKRAFEPSITPTFEQMPGQQPRLPGMEGVDFTAQTPPTTPPVRVPQAPPQAPVTPPPVAAAAPVPPTNPGVVGDPTIVTLKKPTAALLAYWRDTRGYVPIGVGPEGAPQLVRPDLAPLYQNPATRPAPEVGVDPTAPVVTPTPPVTPAGPPERPDVAGPAKTGQVLAGDEHLVDASKVTPAYIQNMAEGGYYPRGTTPDGTKIIFKPGKPGGGTTIGMFNLQDLYEKYGQPIVDRIVAYLKRVLRRDPTNDEVEQAIVKEQTQTPTPDIETTQWPPNSGRFTPPVTQAEGVAQQPGLPGMGPIGTRIPEGFTPGSEGIPVRPDMEQLGLNFPPPPPSRDVTYSPVPGAAPTVRKGNVIRDPRFGAGEGTGIPQTDVLGQMELPWSRGEVAQPIDADANTIREFIESQRLKNALSPQPEQLNMEPLFEQGRLHNEYKNAPGPRELEDMTNDLGEILERDRSAQDPDLPALLEEIRAEIAILSDPYRARTLRNDIGAITDNIRASHEQRVILDALYNEAHAKYRELTGPAPRPDELGPLTSPPEKPNDPSQAKAFVDDAFEMAKYLLHSGDVDGAMKLIEDKVWMLRRDGSHGFPMEAHELESRWHSLLGDAPPEAPGLRTVAHNTLVRAKTLDRTGKAAEARAQILQIIEKMNRRGDVGREVADSLWNDWNNYLFNETPTYNPRNYTELQRDMGEFVNQGRHHGDAENPDWSSAHDNAIALIQSTNNRKDLKELIEMLDAHADNAARENDYYDARWISRLREHAEIKLSEVAPQVPPYTTQYGADGQPLLPFTDRMSPRPYTRDLPAAPGEPPPAPSKNTQTPEHRGNVRVFDLKGNTLARFDSFEEAQQFVERRPDGNDLDYERTTPYQYYDGPFVDDPEQLKLKFNKRMNLEIPQSKYDRLIASVDPRELGRERTPESHAQWRSYGSGARRSVGEGRPGLNVDRNRSGKATSIVYRGTDGKPIAVAVLDDFPDGSLGISSISTDSDKGIASKIAIMAVVEKAFDMNAMAFTTIISENTAQLIRGLQRYVYDDLGKIKGKKGGSEGSGGTSASFMGTRDILDLLNNLKQKVVSRMKEHGIFVEGESLAGMISRFAKKLINEDEGSFDPTFLNRPPRKPLRGDEEIPSMAFQPDEGVATDREFSGKFANTDMEAVNKQTHIAPEGRMNEISLHYPSILEEAKTIYNETDALKISQNLARYKAEFEKVRSEFYNAQRARNEQNIPVPQEITDAFNRSFRLTDLAQAKYERASVRQLEGKPETTAKTLKDFWMEDQGATPLEAIFEMWNKTKEKMGWGGGETGRKRGEDEVDWVREVMAVPTNATTTGDLSAPGRQGLSMILTPQFWKAAGKMFQGLHKGSFDAIDAEVRSKPMFRKRIDPETGKVNKSFAEEAGVKLFEPASGGGPRAEMTASRWLERGIGKRVKVDGRMVWQSTPGSRAWANTIGVPIRATNRGYITFLNVLNANRFEFLVNRARDMSVKGMDTGRAPMPGILGGLQLPEMMGGGNIGLTQKFTRQEAMDLNPYHNLELAKEIADFVNTATGHGPLKTHVLPSKHFEVSLEHASSTLGKVLFSPGLLASRIRMLNPSTYIMATPYVRKQYFKAALSTYLAWAAYTEMLKYAAGDEAEIGDVPTSADYGKVRIGDARLDVGGGFLQFATAVARFWEGGSTSSASNEFKRFGSGYQAQTQEQMAERFMVNKLNPLTKFAYDVYNATEYNPFHVGDRTAQLFVPLFIQDVIGLAKERPDLLPMFGGAAFFGGGTQIYEKGESISKFINPENDWLVSGGGAKDLMPWNWGKEPGEESRSFPWSER